MNQQGWGWTGLLAVALWASLAVACKPPEEGEDKGKTPEEKEFKRPVETTKIESVDFVNYIRLLGETEADETVTVASELPGRVISSDMKEGQVVEKNHRLARIDVRTDQTRMGQLRVALDQSKRDLKRSENLLTKGLATPADVERAQLAVDNQEYSLRLLRQGVGKSTVRAPISGIVDRVHVKTGEYVNPGMPVATVVNHDSIIVRAGLPESQIRYGREGATLTIEIPALETRYEGTIRRVGLQADTRNRTFPLEVEIENKDHVLRAGMRAQVLLPASSYKGAVLVPRDAVIEGLTGRFAFVIEGGRAQRRDVTLGDNYEDYVVISKGVKFGEELVVVGQQDLSDKEAVNVVKTGKCCKAQTESAKVPDPKPTAQKGVPSSRKGEAEGKAQGKASANGKRAQ